MSKFEKLINSMIKGERGCWYYDFELGSCHIGGGYFFSKRDARRHLKAKLRNIITHDEVIIDYFELKFGAPL
jgi:hypothetical protein